MILANFLATFTASIRSVGTASTLAAVGMYLHRRGFIAGDGKRTLALISQQVTIPALLFTKILYCNQDWSSDPCPNVTASLRDTWMLLVWPAYVVGWGLVVGWMIAKWFDAPMKEILAACAFGNSTGLPITLLAVIHSQFPVTTELGRIDPTIFLSEYLILYPALQWGIGGWILCPDTEDNDIEKHGTKKNKEMKGPLINRKSGSSKFETYGTNNDNDTDSATTRPLSSSLDFIPEQQKDQKYTIIQHNVLNNKISPFYRLMHSGLADTDASFYMSNRHLQEFIPKLPTELQHALLQQVYSADSDDEDRPLMIDSESEPSLSALSMRNTNSDKNIVDLLKKHSDNVTETATAIHFANGNNSHQEFSASGFDMKTIKENSSMTQTYKDVDNATSIANNNNDRHEFDLKAIEGRKIASINRAYQQRAGASDSFREDPDVTLKDLFQKIVSRCFQPPVFAALLGLLIALFPSVRGIFVDIVNRDSSAPLQFFFDGLYNVGQAAVPINMMILGTNLSASLLSITKKTDASPSLLPFKTMLGIVFGKMVLMPTIGILSVMFFSTFVWDIPHDIDSSLYLVMMIVFITPTANNVMVMVELGGGAEAKESLARVIGLEYLFAPVLLCITVACVVHVAANTTPDDA